MIEALARVPQAALVAAGRKAALVLGQDPGPLPAKAPFDETTVLAELRAGLPSELLVSRPDIISAEHQLRASNAHIGAARAAFLPRIALTGSFGTASSDLNGLFDSGSRAWTFMPTLSLPIFDGGRRRANLELSEVRRDIAVAGYEKTIQTAFREVADALSAKHWLAEQLTIQRANLEAQSERARLAKLRYDNGSAAFLEVLDAQRDLLGAQQQLVQARRALLSSQVALYAALGGGTLVTSVYSDDSAWFGEYERRHDLLGDFDINPCFRFGGMRYEEAERELRLDRDINSVCHAGAPAGRQAQSRLTWLRGLLLWCGATPCLEFHFFDQGLDELKLSASGR